MKCLKRSMLQRMVMSIKHVNLFELFDKVRWMFPKIGVPQNGWFIMENPIKMEGYHYFWKHPDGTS